MLRDHCSCQLPDLEQYAQSRAVYIFFRIIPDFDNDSPNSLTRVRDPFN